jgi:hypothetical protein
MLHATTHQLAEGIVKLDPMNHLEGALKYLFYKFLHEND